MTHRKTVGRSLHASLLSRRTTVYVVLAALVATTLGQPAVVTAASTPNPTSVTVAGSLQSEAGCPGDWDPTCATTHLTYDAGDDVWQGTFALPAGSYEYKAALNDAWDENYGLHAVPGGANIPFTLPSADNVKFYYDHKSHWITDNKSSVIAVAPGSFQSELGCPADWDPGCLRSWLQDPDGDGIYTFSTTALPAGSYDTKVAINEDWTENYGQGGVLNGSNITFNVPVDNTLTTFSYDSTSHVLTVTVAAPAGAPGWPGALSHFDLARKDCVGTARNSTSKVWFTVANGVLSDVYYPTVDNTNVETLQYVVTDGSTFTDLQTRDMTYSVQAITGTGGMGCKVTETAKSGKYRIETEYITDPAHNTVLMRVRFAPKKPGYQLYLRYDPTVNGNGGGGAGNGGPDSATVDSSTGHPVLVASDPNTTTNAANRDYAQPVYTALDGALSDATSGFVGASSDGLVQLDASHALTQLNNDATGGNVVQTARLNLGSDGRAVVSLGFGASQAEAVGAAEASLAPPFDRTLAAYRQGWQRYDNSLNDPQTQKPRRPHAVPARPSSRTSTTRARTCSRLRRTRPSPGRSSPASPHRGVRRSRPVTRRTRTSAPIARSSDATSTKPGRASSPTATSPPHARRRCSSCSASSCRMDRCRATVSSTARPLPIRSTRSSTRPPTRSSWRSSSGSPTPRSMPDHIKPAANFLIAHGPSFGPERWEEQGGYSPSTIAAEIAGLVAAADLARSNGDPASAAVWLGVADDWQRSIKGWTVTTNGPLSAHPYFIRLSKTGDPNAAISYNVGNGGPTLDQRSVIDAGFLELVRLGELPANDPDVLRSLPVVDATIRSETANGPGWHRYNGDGYGDSAADGQPWAPSGKGTGHVWPALSAERGEQHLATGTPPVPPRCSTPWPHSRPASDSSRSRTGRRPPWRRRRSAPIRRLLRSASPTEARRARPRHSHGRPPRSCGWPATSPPTATSFCPPSPGRVTSPTSRARRR